MSIPLASTSEVPCTICGRARATTNNPRASIRNVPNHLPAFDLRATAKALAVWVVEYLIAVAMPFLPFKKARGGIRTSSHNTSGWLKWNIIYLLRQPLCV